MQVATNKLKIGDVIKSKAFTNLLFKDLEDLDPMMGFNVNPYKEIRTWDNHVGFMIENPGTIRVNNLNADGTIKKSFKTFRFAVDPESTFVVKAVTFKRDASKEQISEESMDGEYPLTIDAIMMGPNGEYDEFGIVITFCTNSTRLPHVIESVEKVGFYDLIPF